MQTDTITPTFDCKSLTQFRPAQIADSNVMTEIFRKAKLRHDLAVHL